MYPVEIEIELIDRVGLLKDISAKIADIKTNIRAARIRTVRERFALVNLVVDVADVAHLQRVMTAVGRMSDVIKVYRVTKKNAHASVKKGAS
jgi:GTP pyrophosphokinase